MVFRILLFFLGVTFCSESAYSCTAPVSWSYNYRYLAVGLTNTENYVNPTPVKPHLVSYKPVSNFESVLLDADAVHISRAKLDPIVRSSVTWKDTVFARATFLPEEILKGDDQKSFEYFANDDELRLVIDIEHSRGDWSRHLDELRTSTEAWIGQHEESFSFWDEIPIRSPTTWSHEYFTSCGPPSYQTLLADQLYLVIESEGETRVVEPVSGLDDPFVLAVKTFLADIQATARRELTIEQYFSNMAGLIEFQLTGCSAHIVGNEKRYDSSALNRVYEPAELRFDLVRIDVEGSPENETYLTEQFGALFEYFDNSKEKISCERPQKFLAFWRKPETKAETTYFRQSRNSYKTPHLRFARIEADEVILTDIKTNYIIADKDPVPVDKVFSWVREAKGLQTSP